MSYPVKRLLPRQFVEAHLLFDLISVRYIWHRIEIPTKGTCTCSNYFDHAFYWSLRNTGPGRLKVSHAHSKSSWAYIVLAETPSLDQEFTSFTDCYQYLDNLIEK